MGAGVCGKLWEYWEIVGNCPEAGGLGNSVFPPSPIPLPLPQDKKIPHFCGISGITYFSTGSIFISLNRIFAFVPAQI